MRFLHVADLHIGKNLHQYSLLDEQKFILNEILNIALSRNVDALLLAGDIFDKSNPSQESISVVEKFFYTCHAHNLALFVVSGNHDSPTRLGFASKFLVEHEVYVGAKLQDQVARITFTRGEETVDIYLLPYLRPLEIKRNLFSNAELVGGENYSNLVELYLAQVREQAAARKLAGIPSILVGHQWVIGLSEASLESDSECNSVGAVEAISDRVFGEIDYIALGHLHRPQIVNCRCVYAGSPLKYSASEANLEKSVIIVDITDNDLSWERQPLIPLRDMRVLTGPLLELIAAQEGQVCEDYVYVNLTDEQIPYAPGKRLRTVFPYLCQVRFLAYEEAASRATFSAESKLENESLEDLFLKFFAEESGHLASDRQKAYLNEILMVEGQE